MKRKAGEACASWCVGNARVGGKDEERGRGGAGTKVRGPDDVPGRGGGHKEVLHHLVQHLPAVHAANTHAHTGRKRTEWSEGGRQGIRSRDKVVYLVKACVPQPHAQP